MKHCNYLFRCMAIVITIAITGCKKNWIDVNYSPQDLTDNKATPDVILPTVLEGATSTINNWPLCLWMGYWSHWNMNINYPLLTYFRIQELGDNFQYLTARPRPEIFYLEEKARAMSQPFYLGAAKVIKALR